MCNAWNHPPSCTCGFGGEGHTGYRASHSPHSSNQSYGVPEIKPALESYVIPNAACPVCGDLVFFYQSPDGGRVFFDELGPPWPKHPCTDHTSIPAMPDMGRIRGSKVGAKTYSRQEKGWSPFFIYEVSVTDKIICMIRGKYQKKFTKIYSNRILLQNSSLEKLNKSTVMFLKETKRGSCKISLLSGRGKHIEADASFHLNNVQEAIPGNVRRAISEGEFLREKYRRKATEILSNSDDAKVGTVESYDPLMGFGFIETDLGCEKIFIHKSVLKRWGIQSLSEGERVRVMSKLCQRGLQVETIEKL